jgi:hypothetical protein
VTGPALQAVLAHTAEFLQANAASLDLTPSTKYAFKWLQLADTAGLTAPCKTACIDRIVALDRSSCTADKLEGLSRQTLVYLVEAALSVASYFRYCNCTREFHSSLFIASSNCGP